MLFGMLAQIKSYFQEINLIRKTPNANETTYRTPLENLVNIIWGKNFTVRQEASSETGIPDFTIWNKSAHIIGCIECKKPDFDLNHVLEHKKSKEYEQLCKYFTWAKVILFTNYFSFYLLEWNNEEKDINVLDKVLYRDVKNLLCDDILRLLNLFVQARPMPVKNRDSLIRMLADKTKYLRDMILDELENSESYLAKSEIQTLFSKTLYRDLDKQDFADAFAQIITFSQIFCRLTKHTDISRQDFANIPAFIPILKEILGKFNLEEMSRGILYLIDSIIDTVNIYDEAIFFPQGKSYKDDHDIEDPFIYLYEQFLKEFNPQARNARGVFYTPIQIVRYLIKSTDEILKTRLSSAKGIIDNNIHILDFATGTGTFLLSAIEYAYKELIEQENKGMWKTLVQDFILKNLYGFEYLIVPYILAHFRIYEYLKDCDYKYQNKERLKLYLTNTLDQSEPEKFPLFTEFNDEADAAQKVKTSTPILVVMGNPPYNSKSDPMNSKKWIQDELKIYQEDGDKKLTGTEKQKLNDDYIKFLRFAQWKIDTQEKGLVSVIVNNSFLDGVSHRLMRKSLMESFDEIYIFNLHGNGNKGEKTLDGEIDANVFPIQSAGVCMLLLVKTGKKSNPYQGVYYQELFAPKREAKLSYLNELSWQTDLDSNRWIKLEDTPQWHWFIPRAAQNKYWDEFRGLAEIFSVYNSGIETGKDELIIHFSEKELHKALEAIKTQSPEEIAKLYYLKESQSKTEQLMRAKKEVENNQGNITSIHYRPFDFRKIYYAKKSGGITRRPVYDTMRHLIDNDNIGLMFVRYVVADIPFEHILISSNIIDKNFTAYQTYFAPLYCYDKQKELELSEDDKNPNWTDDFKKFLEAYHTKTPEDILSYIYAILYAPSYREKYADDLSYDYPRIPFTTDKKQFDDLFALGQKLIDLHLMKAPPSSKPSFPIEGDRRITCIEYRDNKIYINQDQYFDHISPDVWNYTIGGYQVLHKWISSRKDRILDFSDIQHVQQVAELLKETISIQKEIDKYKSVWDE